MNIALYLVLILLILTIILIVTYGIKLQQLSFKITNKNIADSVRSQFLNLSPSSQSLVELAIEVWRLEKRIQKSSEGLSDDQKKAFHNSLSILQRYLEKNDISVTDYTDAKYNEGLNLEILSIEKDPSIPHSIVKETHEPAVMHKGQLIKKAKVVVLEK
ncbi:hypothetical protein KC960_05095 [Candidatus Saccharibacteria bacterium]|nr:hypothetical protein [Candidatus Saccharibacteria bacterium]